MGCARAEAYSKYSHVGQLFDDGQHDACISLPCQLMGTAESAAGMMMMMMMMTGHVGKRSETTPPHPALVFWFWFWTFPSFLFCSCLEAKNVSCQLSVVCL